MRMLMIKIPNIGVFIPNFLTKYILSSTLLLCAAGIFTQSASACEVQNLVKDARSLANLLSDGSARLVRNSVECLKVSTTENESAKSGYAVLFTMLGWENSNAVTEYLAYFDTMEQGMSLKNAEKFALVDFLIVGGGGWRQVHLSTVEKNKIIVLSGREYRTTDLYCCPTKSIQARYKLQARRLVPLAGSGGL